MPGNPWRLFRWSEQNSIHVAEIDAGHRLCHEIAERMHQAMLLGHGKEALDVGLVELGQAFFALFALEEVTMAELHYPEAGAHRAEHDAIRQRVLGFNERFAHGETALTIELLQFVTATREQHHLTSDRKLGEWVKAEKTFATYMERLLRGDRMACGVIVGALLDEGVTMKDIFVKLLQRALYQIGTLWQQNEMSDAVEHRASEITRRMIGLISERSASASATRRAWKAIVTCVAGENHQFGGQMVAELLELRGWEAHFLGTNTLIDSLLEMVEEEEPNMLALSVTMASHLGAFNKTVQSIRRKFPRMVILAGGQGLRHMRPNGLDPYLHYVRSLDELDAWIASVQAAA